MESPSARAAYTAAAGEYGENEYVDVVVYVFRNDCGKIGILYKTAQIFETLGRIAYIELVEYGYVYHQLSMHCPPVTGIACPVSYFCSTA